MEISGATICCLKCNSSIIKRICSKFQTKGMKLRGFTRLKISLIFKGSMLAVNLCLPL
jgi:hypothetical protein